MDHGKIIQVDTPAKIYEEPGSVYVADFIGDVNLIEGSVTTSGDDHATISWGRGGSRI